MADIDIVPKGRSSTWMWVVLAIVVIALLMWFMMGRSDTPSTGITIPSGAEMALATPAEFGT